MLIGLILFCFCNIIAILTLGFYKLHFARANPVLLSAEGEDLGMDIDGMNFNDWEVFDIPWAMS